MKAIVVGAGIGGVATAVGLERAGWQVILLERAAELGEVGAGISIWPAAVAALERLGVTGVERVARQTGVVVGKESNTAGAGGDAAPGRPLDRRGGRSRR